MRRTRGLGGEEKKTGHHSCDRACWTRKGRSNSWPSYIDQCLKYRTAAVHVAENSILLNEIDPDGEGMGFNVRLGLIAHSRRGSGSLVRGSTCLRNKCKGGYSGALL